MKLSEHQYAVLKKIGEAQTGLLPRERLLELFPYGEELAPAFAGKTLKSLGDLAEVGDAVVSLTGDGCEVYNGIRSGEITRPQPVPSRTVKKSKKKSSKVVKKKAGKKKKTGGFTEPRAAAVIEPAYFEFPPLQWSADYVLSGKK